MPDLLQIFSMAGEYRIVREREGQFVDDDLGTVMTRQVDSFGQTVQPKQDAAFSGIDPLLVLHNHGSWRLSRSLYGDDFLFSLRKHSVHIFHFLPIREIDQRCPQIALEYKRSQVIDHHDGVLFTVRIKVVFRDTHG